MKVVWFGFLCLMAGWDLCRRKIPVVALVMCGAVGGLGTMTQAVMEWNGYADAAAKAGGIMISMAVGGALLLLGKMTEGALGSGDGYFFLVSGFYLSWEQSLGLLCYGLLLSSFWGLGVLAWGNCKKVPARKMRMPFLPFVWLAAVLWRGVMQ